MKGFVSLNDYLGNTQLTDQFILTDNTSFHWSNWEHTCVLQKEFYKNFNNNLHLTNLNNSLMELKKIPIWLCNQVEVRQIDLYAMYESYLDSRLRLTWFDRKNELLFSLESGQGPYYTLTSMKWFNKEIYAQFVMRKILLEQFTLRSFRLNITLPVIFKLDNDLRSYHGVVAIHQLSEVGIIFRFGDKNLVNKIKNASMLDFHIPIKLYEGMQKLDYADSWEKLSEAKLSTEEDLRCYKLDARVLNFYGNHVNAQKSGDKEFFLFAKYEDLTPQDHDVNLLEVLNPLVNKTKKYFIKDLEIISKKQKAA